MTLAIRSQNASSSPMRTFEKAVIAPGVAADATSISNCVVFKFEDHIVSVVETPAHHKPIGTLVGEWDKNDKRRVAMEQARQWIVETFHVEDADTVRTLRLRKGWSQTQLAKELATSQPHVTRIERGTENLSIETCRRLCSVLGIDMNTLDQALRKQEALSQAKTK